MALEIIDLGVEMRPRDRLAAASIGALISDFSFGAVFPDAANARGFHLLIVEFGDPSPGEAEAARFVEKLDETLQMRNDDYRAHRAGGFGLDPPRLRVVPRGTFEAWMTSRGKLGGQNKVPRLIADAALFESLTRFVATRA